MPHSSNGNAGERLAAPPDAKRWASGNILGDTTARWDNGCMKIAIDLSPAQSEQLEAIAASLGVPAEQLAQAAVTDLIDASAADFDDAASRVLEKNRELYRRLS